MKTRKISKGWLLSPIIIATIISLLTMTFHWTDLNMGFQLTPSMLRYMHQPASVRLDYTQLPEALILQGNVDLRIESGEEFAIWVSPFIAYFAEIRQTDRSLTIRTSHAPANRNLTEIIRITLPTDNLMPSDITITGNSQFSLHNLQIQHLNLTSVGKQIGTITHSQVQHLTLSQMGVLTLYAEESKISHSTTRSLGRIQDHEQILSSGATS